MGCTVCTEPQCLYSTAIPLLPLWAVRPVQSLSACVIFSYRLFRAFLNDVEYSESSGSVTGQEFGCLSENVVDIIMSDLILRI